MWTLQTLNYANVNLQIENSKTVESPRVHFKRITPISPRCATYEQKWGGSWQLHQHTCHKTSRTQNTYQYMSSYYTINDIDFWRVPIHGQGIEIRHHHPIRNMVKERETSFRICQFAWNMSICQFACLLQKQRWEKRWWCRRLYKKLYYIITVLQN